MAETRVTKAGVLVTAASNEQRVTKAGVLAVVSRPRMRATKAGVLTTVASGDLRVTKAGVLAIVKAPTPLIEPIHSIEIELWSDYLAAGGDRIAILSDHESILRGGRYRLQIDRDEELVLVLPQEVVAAAGSQPTGVGTPVVIATSEIETSHGSIVLPVGPGGVPVGATVFVDWTSAPNPSSVTITDSRGNDYTAQVEQGAAHLYRGFVTTALQDGDAITILPDGNLNQSAAAAYYIMGLADADGVDSAHVLNGGSVGPITVPVGGFVAASAYMFNTDIEGAFVQDPNFTDIDSARAEASETIIRLVRSAFRRGDAVTTYDPTAETGARRLTVASYAPILVPTFARQPSKAALVELGRVIRVSDGIHAPTWWRLIRREEGRGVNTGTVRLTAVSPHEELGRALLRTTTAGGSTRFSVAAELTPAEWVDQFVLPALQAEGMHWIKRGTVEFEQPLRYELSEATPLLLMNLIERDTGGEWRLETGATLEQAVFVLSLRERIGKDAPERLMMFGRNVLHLERDTEHGQTYGTVVVPTGHVSDADGAPATIAEAVFQVVGIPGIPNAIDVAAPQAQLVSQGVATAGYLLGLPAQMVEGTSVKVTAELRNEQGVIESYDPDRWSKSVISGDATLGGPDDDELTMGATPGPVAIQFVHQTGVAAGGSTVLVATSGSFLAALAGLPASVVEGENYQVHALKRDASTGVIVENPSPATFSVPSGPASITGANDDIVSVEPDSAPDQITVVATLNTPEMEQDSADSTVVEGPQLPPIPPPNPGNYSVILQPAGGHTVIANFNGSTKIWPGWTLGGEWLNENRVRVVNDSAAKFGKAIEKRFFQGEAAGGWKGNARRNIGLWGELYVRFVIAYSTTWVWHSGGGKFVYLHNAGTGSARRNFVLQGAAGGAGGQLPTGGGRVPCIVDFGSGIGQWVPYNTPALARGVYHTVEYLINADIGDTGGSLRMAIDGVPVSEYFLVGAGTISPLTNVNWRYNDNVGDKRVGAEAETFLYWGGSNQNVQADMYIRLSEFYMSGRN